MNKSKLCQFYTTKYEYILQNMSIPPLVKNIVEPFVGSGDLLKFVKNKDITIECYDIEPKCDGGIKRDTLLNPPCYDNKFVLTNPPYLARNKSESKEIYNKYKCNDLYKCFIMCIINSECCGGIIIVPLNFICSIRSSDVKLREEFLHKYDITVLNIFEERVFKDTSYAVCCFQFTRKMDKPFNIKTYIYPSNKEINIILNKDNNFTIGGEIYNLTNDGFYNIYRATWRNIDDFEICLTNIVLKCIDDQTKIQLFIAPNHGGKTRDFYMDNTIELSQRSYALLIINPPINMEMQHKLVNDFNNYINSQRSKYNSLFLTNYRDKSRKRISFELAFDVCKHLLSN